MARDFRSAGITFRYLAISLYPMKIRHLLILLVILYTTGCREEESIQQGNVQFSFSSVNTDQADARQQLTDIPAGSFLRLTVTKANGDSVFTSKKIALIKTGNDLLTDPVKLPKGGYVITDFMIVDPQDSLLFAIPKRGSDLAKWVKNPLSVQFTVGTEAVSNIEGEVISAFHRNPKDFGYSSFGAKVISIPGFSVTVFSNDLGKVKLATADCAILHGADTVFKKSLTASLNELNWNADPKTSYTLVVTKEGYAKYQQEFSLDTLTAGLLPIVLEPALTIRWTLNTSTIYLDGKTGANLVIDWGDNTIEQASLQETGFSHTYAASANYFVSITGDLDAISFFELEYQDGINSVSPIQLTSLEDFRLPLCQYTSTTLDLSRNAKLNNLDLSGVRGNLTEIDISNNNALLNLDLQADNLSSDAMNKMIDDLYASCVLHNQRNGYLDITPILFDNPYNPSSRDLIGPPSAAQVEKLNKLISDYGWFVFPINTLTPADVQNAGRINAKHLTGKFTLLEKHTAYHNN